MEFLVKKTIAAGGASVLGLTAAGLGAASPAAALVTEPCDDVYDHEITVGAIDTNWYMDCVPQYAVAGVDFTITSPTGFPDDFAPLNTNDVTVIASTGAEGAEYLGTPYEGFDYLYWAGGDETSQSYEGTMIFEIDSVGSTPVASLPSGCGTDFTTAWVVNYVPATVTFTQVVDGVEWRYDVVAAPGPLYLGLNILGETGTLDPTRPACASANGDTFFAQDSVDDAFFTINGIATTYTAGAVESLNPYFGEGKSLPDVSRYVAPKPELPATGSDFQPAVPVGIAALFLSLGVAAGVLRRRRASEVTD